MFEPTILYLTGVFGNSVEDRAAKELILKAMKKAEIEPQKAEYSMDETIQICEVIKEGGGFLKTIAFATIALARTSKIEKKK